MILGVNIDHIATLREARGGFEPDPLMAAPLALLGGADGITVHLREDRRHIRDRDLQLLRETVPVELNLEMAATEEMIRIALAVKPDLVTFVPEKRQERTTEGGLAVVTEKDRLSEAVKKIQGAAIPVSLFINPLIMDIDVARNISADMVEIHTGYYANAKGEKQDEELLRIKDSLKVADQIGLKVNAGHGLNYYNVQKISGLREVRGLYIGHSIISRAVLVGMERAVREMKELITQASPVNREPTAFL